MTGLDTRVTASPFCHRLAPRQAHALMPCALDKLIPSRSAMLVPVSHAGHQGTRPGGRGTCHVAPPPTSHCASTHCGARATGPQERCVSAPPFWRCLIDLQTQLASMQRNVLRQVDCYFTIGMEKNLLAPATRLSLSLCLNASTVHQTCAKQYLFILHFS